jgi:hypothetical protein
MKISYNREVHLTLSLKKLVEKYGGNFDSHYFAPSIMDYGIPDIVYKDSRFYYPEIQKDLDLLKEELKNPPTPSEADELEYFNILLKATTAYNIKQPSTLHELYALGRYEALGILDNKVLLSTSPNLKKKWGITQELFGNYFITNTKFCSLFSELEGCGCQFGTMNSKNLKPGKIYLVNPPFEKRYLMWTCERVLLWLENKKIKNVKFYVIVPVWDVFSRKKLNLDLLYGDVPQITQLINSPYVIEHTTTIMKFYDFVDKKEYPQTSYIHTIVLKK